jgi:TRAP-type C4-dicarboxylate transport system permease small subunit
MAFLGSAPVRIEKGIHSVSKTLGWIASAILVMLAISVLVDVVARNINQPITGNVEVAEPLLVAIAYFALAYTYMHRGHIRVEVIYTRFSARAKDILDTITTILGTGVFGVMVWALVSRVVSIATSSGTGPLTPGILEIPLAPMFVLIAIGVFILCLELILDIVKAVTRVIAK